MVQCGSFLLMSLLTQITLCEQADVATISAQTLKRISTEGLVDLNLSKFQFWDTLNFLATRVIEVQNVDLLPDCYSPVFVIIYDAMQWRSAERIQKTLSGVYPNAVFFVYLVPEFFQMSVFHKVDLSLHILSVIILTDKGDFLSQYIELVGTGAHFKWTFLKHVCEWVIVSSHDVTDILETRGHYVDFITVISKSETGALTVSQKSRTDSLSSVIEVDTECVENLVSDDSYSRELDVFQECDSTSTQMTLKNKLRKTGLLFLLEKKSLMDGLHVTVPMFVVRNDSGNYSDENLSALDAVASSLLHLVADHLGFTYHIVLVADNKYYGSVTQTGATGITGMLARREVALSILPLAMIDNRLQLVDYVHYPTILESNKIIYRLPSHEDSLDLTFVNIISPNFVVFLIGPLVLIAVVGAVVHVATKSCTVSGPLPLSLSDLKLLVYYPKHMCLDAEVKTVNQSGRILKASWGVFWVILGSAYSAYLTTTLSIKSDELTIDSLEDLVAAPGYNFGINGRMSGLLTKLEQWQQKDAISKTWTLLKDRSSHDPLLITDNATMHMLRVLAGSYVFITTVPLNGINLKKLKADYADLRIYNLREFPDLDLDFIGLPKKVFYKEDLHKCLLRLEESQINEHLRQQFLHVQQSSGRSMVSDQEPITLAKLRLVLYAVVGGMAVSAVQLVVEMVFVKRFCQRLGAWIKSNEKY
ncbi:glutamate receptor ionotropic kainate [Biomphalaria glabrata]|nr:glutamate receptor ionotropic; kainate 5 isoform X2 [Biomphalaria glabrata]